VQRSGHPADLDEEVEELYTTDGKAVNWMFVSPAQTIICGKLDGDLNSGSGESAPGSSATMSVWSGATLADTGENVTVYDSSTLPFITAGYKIASGVAITASVTAGKWYFRTPAECEVAQ
jgi:hypothetical protein